MTCVQLQIGVHIIWEDSWRFHKSLDSIHIIWSGHFLNGTHVKWFCFPLPSPMAIGHRLGIFLSAFRCFPQYIHWTTMPAFLVSLSLSLSCFLGFFSLSLCTCSELVDVIISIHFLESSVALTIWRHFSRIRYVSLNKLPIR